MRTCLMCHEPLPAGRQERGDTLCRECEEKPLTGFPSPGSYAFNKTPEELNDSRTRWDFTADELR